MREISLNQVCETTYSNPPIVEAAAELRFDQSAENDTVREIAKALKTWLPVQKEQELHEFEVRVTNGSRAGVQTRHERTGKMRFHLSDNDAIASALISPDSLVASRLPPYTNFDDLISHLNRVWEAVHKITGYRKISRVGLRYINRIDIPFKDGQVDHETYFKIGIQSPIIGDSVKEFGLAFDTEVKAISGLAKVQFFIGEPALLDHLSFYLDIDVISNEDLPQKPKNIFDLYQNMRQVKNEIFEASITDAARELFNG